MAVLVTVVLVCAPFAVQAQNLDRQELIRRFRQARAEGTLGAGGMGLGNIGGVRGGGMRGSATGEFAARRNNRSQRQAVADPRVWEKVERKLDVSYGEGPLEKLDLYIPKEKTKVRMPILMFFHGGGWRIGDKQQHGGKGALYAQNGIVFINTNYGLAPSVVHPQQVMDVAKAIKYTVDHAHDWGGDPERIFLMGHSAGAHLVDLVATNQRFLKQAGVKPTSIKGVISLDTASLDLLKRGSDGSVEAKQVGAMIEQAFGKNPEMLKDGSPALNIHKGIYYPPFLMYCGERRRAAVEQHKEFAGQLNSAGATVSVRPVALSHRDINLAAGDASTQIFKESKAFIESGKL